MTRRRTRWLSAILTAATAVTAVVAAVAVNTATEVSGDWPLGLDAVREHPFVWVGGLTVLVVVLALASWRIEHSVAAGPVTRPGTPLHPNPALASWTVDRPDEVEQVVSALIGSGSGRTVGITTALHGAGGFGKTTVAAMACADERVRRRFGSRIHTLTFGRDVRGPAAVVAKVNDLVSQISQQPATFTDPEQAGQWLGKVLDQGPERLLVLDDVWHEEQVAPFRVGGAASPRLLTTRNSELLGGEGVVVRVDQMSAAQAESLLTWALPPMAPAAVAALLSETGRWPLLLRLCNKILTAAVRTGEDVTAAAGQLNHRLQIAGALAVDELNGEADRVLDVADPRQRQRAVRATIAASLDLLSPAERARFGELAVFAEDEAVPVEVIGGLWQATAGYEPLNTRLLCARLADLALVSLDPDHGGTVELHDVLRDLLRQESAGALADLNGALVDALAAGLPATPTGIAWWELDDDARYLWDHLVEHLLAAGRGAQAEAVAGDLRWVAARLRRSGVASAHADLALVGTAGADDLAATLARISHLLAPTVPEAAVVDILNSRVTVAPAWRAQAAALRADFDSRAHPGQAHLLARWPPADLPDPALRRVLTGHDWNISCLVVAPDGRWLAVGDENLVMRLWDARTWEPLAALKLVPGQGGVLCAPDGSWLLAGGPERSAQIWDVAQARVVATLEGLNGWTRGGAVAPDGSWLAIGVDRDSRVGVWDPATGRRLHDLAGHTGSVSRIAAAPDGRWLAVATAADPILNGTDEVRIWDTRSWSAIAVLTGHEYGVASMTVAPDGRWLATGGGDIEIRANHGPAGCETHVRGGREKVVRIWDTTTWQPAADLPDQAHPRAWSAWSPDGRRIFTGGSEQTTVRVWDTGTWTELRSLSDNSLEREALAVAPNGRTMATGGEDGVLRVWDTGTGALLAVREGHPYGVVRVAMSPDQAWVAAASGDRATRIWDFPHTQEPAVPGRQSRDVRTTVIAPDGRWVAVSEHDATEVEILDLTAKAPDRMIAALDEHTSPVVDVAASPDGSQLVTTSRQGEIHVWVETATGFHLQRREKRSWAPNLAFGPDGTWIAVAHGGTIEIWNTTDGKPAHHFAAHDDVTALAASPDGRWLASSGGGDHTVALWDTTTYRKCHTMTGWDGSALSMAFALDGSWMATAGYDSSGIRIFDTGSGELLHLLSDHANAVDRVAAAPDGRWLASVGWDKTLRVWDTTTWQPAALMRFEMSVTSCAWLPAGDGVVVGGHSGVFLFDFLA